MRIMPLQILLLATLILSSCSSTQEISAEESKRQYEIDTTISGILFEYDVADATSYKIRRNGHVILNFSSSVNDETYTAVVNSLRQSSNINGVSASQDGVSICTLP